VKRRPRSDGPSTHEYVGFVDLQVVYKVRVHSLRVLNNLLCSIRISVLVNAIPGVLHGHDVYLEILTESAQQGDSAAEILGIGMEIKHDFLRSVLEKDAWNVVIRCSLSKLFFKLEQILLFLRYFRSLIHFKATVVARA
jgi:hypothetical protein